MIYSHNYSNSSRRGQFSEDGIQQIGSNESFVQCASSHLTSFCVLVDSTGQSVSYQSKTASKCDVIKYPLTFFL